MNERYEIRRKIGQGGLGTVYHAFDSQLHRDVAIKRLFAPVDAAGRVDRESTADKLMREATALSRLNHPNIVSVFDVGVDADGGFVVMELLTGETLTDTIAKGTLTLPDFHQVVIQTLEALIAAEAQNILHRDLKPSNIMLCWLPSGRFLIKVLDFGLAKVSAQPALQTIDQNNSVLGSIFYMAPEQFERRELDFSTDVYSMGCIYYFCLAGKDPFTGRSVADVMNSHLEHRVLPLHEVRPDLPRAVCDWVMWLIRRDMERRPKTAQVALDNFPLVEGSGGAVEVAPEDQFAIPALPEPSRTPETRPSVAPPSRTSSPVPPRRVTSGTRLPPSRTSGPVPPQMTTGARIPAHTSGPIPSPSTSSTRIHSGPVSTTDPSSHSLQGRLTGPKKSPAILKIGVSGAVLAMAIGAIFLLKDKKAVSDPALDLSVPLLTVTNPTSVGEGDEIRLSFQVRQRSARNFRFALMQPERDNPKKYSGYAFDLEERQPLSLSVRSYSGEPESDVSLMSNPKGKTLKTSLSGNNITPGKVSKVELRGKMNAGKNLSFTVTLWDTSNQKAVYTAKDESSPLTSVHAYGFRGERTVVNQVAEAKFTVARPSKPSQPAAPVALNLAVLLDDNFDTGNNPSIGHDADAPNDGDWQQGPWLAKFDQAKKINNINGSNALGISSGKSTLTSFPSVQLVEGRLIEVGFACRIEDQIDSIRLLLANKGTESRGYLVEIGRDVRITLHEMRGQNAKDFPLEVCRQLHQMSPPGFNPKLRDARQIRMSVTRLKDDCAKVQISVDFADRKNAYTSYTDNLAPAPYQFTVFGLKCRGKKGKVLLDNVRIVSSTAPAG